MLFGIRLGRLQTGKLICFTISLWLSTVSLTPLLVAAARSSRAHPSLTPISGMVLSSSICCPFVPPVKRDCPAGTFSEPVNDNSLTLAHVNKSTCKTLAHRRYSLLKTLLHQSLCQDTPLSRPPSRCMCLMNNNNNNNHEYLLDRRKPDHLLMLLKCSNAISGPMPAYMHLGCQISCSASKPLQQLIDVCELSGFGCPPSYR